MILWQKILLKIRKVLRLGLWLFLVLYLGQLEHFSFASETTKVYQVSEEDLTTLEDNLTKLKAQLTLQEKIRQDLELQLKSVDNELTNAQKSLKELEASINSEMKKKLWTGIGIGVGATALLTLIIGLSVGLSK